MAVGRVVRKREYGDWVAELADDARTLTVTVGDRSFPELASLYTALFFDDNDGPQHGIPGRGFLQAIAEFVGDGATVEFDGPDRPVDPDVVY